MIMKCQAGYILLFMFTVYVYWFKTVMDQNEDTTRILQNFEDFMHHQMNESE